jgi:hypothetical protein
MLHTPEASWEWGLKKEGLLPRVAVSMVLKQLDFLRVPEGLGAELRKMQLVAEAYFPRVVMGKGTMGSSLHPPRVTSLCTASALLLTGQWLSSLKRFSGKSQPPGGAQRCWG